MVIAVIVLLGLAAGSFINAFVWRTHQSLKDGHKPPANLSIISGRSICPKCGHQLAARDLIPIVSWLSLRGKCRYCRQGISYEYPLVELLTAAAYLASYLFWPIHLGGRQSFILAVWLLELIFLISLLVYDLHWRLLPNRLMLPLACLAGLQAVIELTGQTAMASTIAGLLIGSCIGGGLFYLLFQISNGKWIGGGDVKLGFILGLIAATPLKSFLLIFVASVLGTVVSLPLLFNKRLKPSSKIAFGPFLITAALIVVLFGQSIVNWYKGITLA